MVALKIVPLFSPCSVQRRGSGARRSAVAAAGPGAIDLSEAFEELIVHRQKTGACGVAYRTELTALGSVDRRNRHAGHPGAAPPQLDEHLCFDFIATRMERQIAQR